MIGTIRFKFFLLVFLYSCVLIFEYRAYASPVNKAVLVLSPYQYDLPNHKISLRVLQEEFEGVNDIKLDVYHEYLELIRFPDSEIQEQIFDLLRSKYHDKQIDLVILTHDIMLHYWLEKREMILPNTPVVFFSTNTPSIEALKLPLDVTGVSGIVDFRQSIRWILSIRPSLKEIVLIYGNGEAERQYIQPVDIIRKEVGGRVKITDLSSLSLDEIKHQVKILPQSSIVLFELLFEDAAGIRHRPIDVVRELAEVASVPVISGYDQFIGTGTIGGYMYSSAQQAEDAAQIGLRILRGEDVKNIPIKKNQSNRYIFDHLALKRFGFSLSNVPLNSIIKNRQYSLWEAYQTEVIAAISTFTVLLLLVIFLFVLSRKLYRTRLALAHLNINLETKIEERTAELKEANDELKRLSNTDGLTGLMNRRAIQPTINTEMLRKKRFNHSVSFLIFDLDHFKHINDQYGHAAGDRVLVGVAGAVRAAIRNTDSIARWGGEEFVVIAANTNISQAVVLAEKIRKAVESITFENIGTVTVSIGAAEYNFEEDFQQWYERADSALYKAKDGGRNRVIAD